MEQKDSMKINKLVSQLLSIRLARIAFTGIIAFLLSCSLIISKAEAGLDLSIPPKKAIQVIGSSSQGIEGSNVIGDGSIIIFDDFSIQDNSNLPGNVISNGNGSLLDLVKTAANVWTQALPELEDIQIDIAWADFGLVPLAESDKLIEDQPRLVKEFQEDEDELLLTSTINRSIKDALTFKNLRGVDKFILKEVDCNHDNYLDILEIPDDEINEFEETFISIRPESIETDGLAAIFVPTIFQADGTKKQHENQFPSAGTIIFNSQDLKFDLDGDGTEETIKFFLDDNPLQSEVFGSATQFDERKGKDSLKKINIGRSSFAKNNQFPLEADDENVLIVDLFSVALHELQHALGTTRVNPEARVNDEGEIVTNDEIKIPTDFEPFIHIDLHTDRSNTPTPVGLETVTFGERKCPSAVDVLAVGEVGFNQGKKDGKLSLNPCRDLASASKSSNIVLLLIFGSGGLLILLILLILLQQGAKTNEISIEECTNKLS